MHRLIGVLFIAATAIVVVLNSDKLERYFADFPKQFRLQVQQDLKKLRQAKKLSSNFFEAREVRYNAHSPLTKALIHSNAPLSSKNPKSPIRVEVDLHEWEDNGELGITVTFNVFEVESDNKIEEFGRTYILFNRRKK